MVYPASHTTPRLLYCTTPNLTTLVNLELLPERIQPFATVTEPATRGHHLQLAPNRVRYLHYHPSNTMDIVAKPRYKTNQEEPP